MNIRPAMAGFILLVAGLHPAVASYRTASEPAGRQAPASAAAGQPAALISFSDEPLKIAEIGLTVKVPTGFSASINSIGAMTMGTISSPDRLWSVSIQVIRVTDPSTTVVQTANATLRSLLRPVELKDKDDDKRTLSAASASLVWPESVDLTDDRQPNLRIDGVALTGERFYVASDTGRDNQRVFQGFTIFKPSPDRFCIFKLIVPEAKYTEARAIYESIVATAQFADPTALATNRRDTVEAGVAYFGRTGTAELIAAMPEAPMVLRLYKPAATASDGDAEELGYRTVRFWRGKRAELSESQTIGAGDNTDGLLCEVKARIITRRGLKNEFQIIDTLARFFLTEDRTEEAWSVSTSMSEPGQLKARTLTEVGARRGDSMSISLVETGKPARNVSPTIGGRGYISQFEAYLLPRLLVRSAVELEIGTYAYRSENESISLRRDVVRKDLASGAWTVATRFRESDQPQTSIFRDNGELVRTLLPDGRVWEPTDLKTVMAMWTRKGLPIK